MKKRMIYGSCVWMLLCLTGLCGCQIVEPEKRAYPLVVGLDWQEEQYQVSFAMARLAESTGQGKEGGEGQEGEEGGALLFCADSKEGILEQYDETQELYLDPGHVQAVVLGQGLLDQPGRIRKVLEGLETESSLGNSAYVFRTEEPEKILEKNGDPIESLGKYLSGLYENRTDNTKPVTLAILYLDLHNRDQITKLPELIPTENGIQWNK